MPLLQNHNRKGACNVDLYFSGPEYDCAEALTGASHWKTRNGAPSLCDKQAVWLCTVMERKGLMISLMGSVNLILALICSCRLLGSLRGQWSPAEMSEVSIAMFACF